jgi:hypothetical protein
LTSHAGSLTRRLPITTILYSCDGVFDFILINKCYAHNLLVWKGSIELTDCLLATLRNDGYSAPVNGADRISVTINFHLNIAR